MIRTIGLVRSETVVKDRDNLFQPLEDADRGKNDNLKNELNGFDFRNIKKNRQSGHYTFDVRKIKGKSFEEKYLEELAALVSDVLQY